MRKTLKKSFAVLMVIFMLIGAIPFFYCALHAHSKAHWPAQPTATL